MPRPDGKTSIAVEMARQGVPPSTISEALGLTPAAVSQRLSEARRAGADVPSFSGRRNSFTRIVIDIPDARVKRMLKQAAVKRGQRPCDLARRILETVLADGLISAVLDDGEVDA